MIWKEFKIGVGVGVVLFLADALKDAFELIVLGDNIKADWLKLVPSVLVGLLLLGLIIIFDLHNKKIGD